MLSSKRSWLLAAGLALVLGAAAPAEDAAVQQKPPAKAADLFASGKVWTIHVQLTAKAWDEMQPKGGGFPFGGFGPGAKPPEKKPPVEGPKDKVVSPFGFDFTYVKGDVEFEKETFKDVGVRFRGNSSYMQASGGLKRPFKLDFNRYVEGQKLSALPSIDLNNNALDPSQVREALAYWVYRQAKVPAPRTAFAKVYVTVEGKHDRAFAGLYTLIEPVNKTFLKDRFKTNNGLLLKPERIFGLTYLGEDWATYEEKYQPRTETTAQTKKRLIDFTKLVNQGDDATFQKEIDKYLDIPEFLRYVAATALMVNPDSFVGIGHNYFLHLHPKTNKFAVLPWDLNLTFGAFPFFGNVEQQAQWSITKPWQGQNKLVERLLAMDKHKQAYQKLVKEMTSTFFTAAKLNAEIDAMTQAIKEAVDLEAKNPPPKAKGGMFVFQAAPELKGFLAKRVDSIALQLAGKAKGFEPTFGFGFGQPVPPPGPPMGKLLFGAMDLNRNGKLSREEFITWHQKVFAAADPDQKGSADDKALAAGAAAQLPKPPAAVGKFNPAPQTLPLARALIKLADVEKKGTIGQLTLLNAAGKLFADADRNQDGSLDEKELTDALAKLLPTLPFGPPGAGPAFGPPGERPTPPGLEPRKEKS